MGERVELLMGIMGSRNVASHLGSNPTQTEIRSQLEDDRRKGRRDERELLCDSRYLRELLPRTVLLCTQHWDQKITFVSLLSVSFRRKRKQEWTRGKDQIISLVVSFLLLDCRI